MPPGNEGPAAATSIQLPLLHCFIASPFHSCHLAVTWQNPSRQQGTPVTPRESSYLRPLLSTLPHIYIHSMASTKSQKLEDQGTQSCAILTPATISSHSSAIAATAALYVTKAKDNKSQPKPNNYPLDEHNKLSAASKFRPCLYCSLRLTSFDRCRNIIEACRPSRSPCVSRCWARPPRVLGRSRCKSSKQRP